MKLKIYLALLVVLGFFLVATSTTSAPGAINYPVSVFRFQVEWDGTRIGFTEVSGLSIETEVIEFREGSDPLTVRKIPGTTTYANIVLKRGVQAGDTEFWDWMQNTVDGSVERRDLTITLLDNKKEPIMVWKVNDAWPTKVTGPSLNSMGNDIAIESIELAHEGLTIEQG